MSTTTTSFSHNERRRRRSLAGPARERPLIQIMFTKHFRTDTDQQSIYSVCHSLNQSTKKTLRHSLLVEVHTTAVCGGKTHSVSLCEKVTFSFEPTWYVPSSPVLSLVHLFCSFLSKPLKRSRPYFDFSCINEWFAVITRP